MGGGLRGPCGIHLEPRSCARARAHAFEWCVYILMCLCTHSDGTEKLNFGYWLAVIGQNRGSETGCCYWPSCSWCSGYQVPEFGYSCNRCIHHSSSCDTRCNQARAAAGPHSLRSGLSRLVKIHRLNFNIRPNRCTHLQDVQTQRTRKFRRLAPGFSGPFHVQWFPVTYAQKAS